MELEATGVQNFIRTLSEKVKKLVAARFHVEEIALTGNPSAADLDLAMMATFERRDEPCHPSRTPPPCYIENAGTVEN